MNNRLVKKKVLSAIGKIYVAILFILIYAPVAVMIAFSFNDSRANVVWSGFTTKYYVKLFSDASMWEVFGTTILVALIATVIGVVIGTLGAVGLTKATFKGRKLIMNSIYFPIVIPEIVLAVATLMMFNQAGVSLSLATIIIGNTTLILPYVYITVKARLVGMDPSIEEASLDLGADRMYTFLHITLPAIMPGVMSGGFMAFSLVLDELIVTSFLANAETVTLPMKVYSMIKKGISPEVNALTTIIFAVCVACLLAYFIITTVKEQKIKRARANALTE